MNKSTIIRFSALFIAIFVVVTFLFVYERKKNNEKEAELNQIIAELEISKQESLDEFENLELS